MALNRGPPLAPRFYNLQHLGSCLLGACEGVFGSDSRMTVETLKALGELLTNQTMIVSANEPL